MTAIRYPLSAIRQNDSRIAVCALLLVVVAGCGRHGKGAPQGGSNVPPSQTKLKRNVDLTQVRQEELPAYVETVGYLDAEGQTDIAAGVTGVVDEVLFREGQWVDRDTVLVKVDQARYVAALEQAKANEKRGESALALAQVLEKFARDVGTAGSAEERARMSGNTRVASAELVAARAARVLAEHNLYRSRVRAPYAGQINQRKITAGTYLEEKTVIATIADLSRLRLVGYIPERSVPMVRDMLHTEDGMRTAFLVGNWMAGRWTGLAGQAVEESGEVPAKFKLEFTLRPFPKQTFYGRIFYLSTVASPDTHMFECKAEVARYGIYNELRPGYTAKINCPLPGRARSLVIPEESERASEHGFIVFRPRPDRDEKTGEILRDANGDIRWIAEEVIVDTGVRKPGKVEVTGTKKKKDGKIEVINGLKNGEWIVQRGAESLEDRTPISFPKAQEAKVLQALGLSSH